MQDKKHTDVTTRECRSEGSFLLLQTFTFALEPVWKQRCPRLLEGRAQFLERLFSIIN